MAGLRIPHDTYVLVGDGAKALILRNEGDETHLNLQVDQLFANDNPPTREQGTDRPGRLHEAMGHKTGVGDTDWHQLAEERFAKDIAERLYQMAHEGRFERLVVVAPPRTLGELRQAFHKEVRAKVIGEVDKDLTGHPIAEMEHVLKALH